MLMFHKVADSDVSEYDVKSTAISAGERILEWKPTDSYEVSL